MDEFLDQTRGNDAGDEPPSGPLPPKAAEALERALAPWLRRGYRVRYRDEQLVQVVSRGWPLWLMLLSGALVLTGVVSLALARRSWHVVSLCASPDGRVVMHRQRTLRPPVP